MNEYVRSAFFKSQGNIVDHFTDVEIFERFPREIWERKSLVLCSVFCSVHDFLDLEWIRSLDKKEMNRTQCEWRNGKMRRIMA
ncbi:hypothetical protein L596_012918 [Steinernema carpocapsae]|uniref:Uncharacterized protein n=1 Tax=Steinernema carpocapsae TaxID=34508 RepID=A0A4U5NYI0_STECR|nr:hypothetical protein L596_012918 [Steinernema carpocapsae]